MAAGQTQQRVHAAAVGSAAFIAPMRRTQGEDAMRGVVFVEFGKDPSGNPVKRRMKFGTLEVGRAQKALGVPLQDAFRSGLNPAFVILNLLYIGITRFEPQWDLEDFADIFDEEATTDKMVYWSEKLNEATRESLPHMRAAVAAKEAADAATGPLEPSATPSS